MNNILRSIFWFIFLPLSFIGACSFFIDMRPSAFYEQLCKQHIIEQKIKSLSEEISQQKEPDNVEKQLNVLHQKIKEEKDKLLHFKNDWGSSVTEALNLYVKRGTISLGDAHLPFLAILYLGMLFIILAISHLNLSFYPRTSSLILGLLLGIISITQWTYIALYAPTLYSKITGAVMILFMLIGFAYCLIRYKKLLL